MISSFDLILYQIKKNMAGFSPEDTGSQPEYREGRRRGRERERIDERQLVLTDSAENHTWGKSSSDETWIDVYARNVVGILDDPLLKNNPRQLNADLDDAYRSFVRQMLTGRTRERRGGSTSQSFEGDPSEVFAMSIARIERAFEATDDETQHEELTQSYASLVQKAEEIRQSYERAEYLRSHIRRSRQRLALLPNGPERDDLASQLRTENTELRSLNREITAAVREELNGHAESDQQERDEAIEFAWITYLGRHVGYMPHVRESFDRLALGTSYNSDTQRFIYGRTEFSIHPVNTTSRSSTQVRNVSDMFLLSNAIGQIANVKDLPLDMTLEGLTRWENNSNLNSNPNISRLLGECIPSIKGFLARENLTDPNTNIYAAVQRIAAEPEKNLVEKLMFLIMAHGDELPLKSSGTSAAVIAETAQGMDIFTLVPFVKELLQKYEAAGAGNIGLARIATNYRKQWMKRFSNAYTPSSNGNIPFLTSIAGDDYLLRRYAVDTVTAPQTEITAFELVGAEYLEDLESDRLSRLGANQIDLIQNPYLSPGELQNFRDLFLRDLRIAWAITEAEGIDFSNYRFLDRLRVYARSYGNDTQHPNAITVKLGQTNLDVLDSYDLQRLLYELRRRGISLTWDTGAFDQLAKTVAFSDKYGYHPAASDTFNNAPQQKAIFTRTSMGLGNPDKSGIEEAVTATNIYSDSNNPDAQEIMLAILRARAYDESLREIIATYVNSGQIDEAIKMTENYARTLAVRMSVLLRLSHIDPPKQTLNGIEIPWNNLTPEEQRRRLFEFLLERTLYSNIDFQRAALPGGLMLTRSPRGRFLNRWRVVRERVYPGARQGTQTYEFIERLYVPSEQNRVRTVRGRFDQADALERDAEQREQDADSAYTDNMDNADSLERDAEQREQDADSAYTANMDNADALERDAVQQEQDADSSTDTNEQKRLRREAARLRKQAANLRQQAQREQQRLRREAADLRRQADRSRDQAQTEGQRLRSEVTGLRESAAGLREQALGVLDNNPVALGLIGLQLHKAADERELQAQNETGQYRQNLLDEAAELRNNADTYLRRAGSLPTNDPSSPNMKIDQQYRIKSAANPSNVTITTHLEWLSNVYDLYIKRMVAEDLNRPINQRQFPSNFSHDEAAELTKKLILQQGSIVPTELYAVLGHLTDRERAALLPYSGQRVEVRVDLNNTGNVEGLSITEARENNAELTVVPTIRVMEGLKPLGGTSPDNVFISKRYLLRSAINAKLQPVIDSLAAAEGADRLAYYDAYIMAWDILNTEDCQKLIKEYATLMNIKPETREMFNILASRNLFLGEAIKRLEEDTRNSNFFAARLEAFETLQAGDVITERLRHRFVKAAMERVILPLAKVCTPTTWNKVKLTIGVGGLQFLLDSLRLSTIGNTEAQVRAFGAIPNWFQYFSGRVPLSYDTIPAISHVWGMGIFSSPIIAAPLIFSAWRGARVAYTRFYRTGYRKFNQNKNNLPQGGEKSKRLFDILQSQQVMFTSDIEKAVSANLGNIPADQRTSNDRTINSSIEFFENNLEGVPLHTVLAWLASNRRNGRRLNYRDDTLKEMYRQRHPWQSRLSVFFQPFNAELLEQRIHNLSGVGMPGNLGGTITTRSS